MNVDCYLVEIARLIDEFALSVSENDICDERCAQHVHFEITSVQSPKYYKF